MSGPSEIEFARFASALTGLSVFGLVWVLLVTRRRRVAHSGGERGDRGPLERSYALTLNLLRRFACLAPSLVGQITRRDASQLIAMAGLGNRISLRDLAAARLIGALLSAASSPLLVKITSPRVFLVVFAIWISAGSMAPIWWLKRRGALRARALRTTLPEALGLLRACLAAGLSMRRSLALVGTHAREPVAGEFAVVGAEVMLGIPQSIALDHLLMRNPIPEVGALVDAIDQAARYGAPLADVISAQAKDATQAINRATVENGARAGPKIQLIVSATLVPSALIAFAAVIIAAVARGDLRLLG